MRVDLSPRTVYTQIESTAESAGVVNEPTLRMSAVRVSADPWQRTRKHKYVR